MIGSSAGGRRAFDSAWLDAALILVLAMALYSVSAVRGHAVGVDEVYHLLAARSWLADQGFSVGDGVYLRATGYTTALAWLFWAFGESESLARLFSVLGASLWVAALLLWLRWTVGRLAAWIAALLFCLAPETVFLSQFIRFYTWHGLAFFLGAVGLYALAIRRPAAPTALVLGAGVAACFAVALHLQLTTVVGLLGLSLWLAIALQGVWLETFFTRPRGPWLLAAAAAVVALVAAYAIGSGIAGRLFEVYRWAPLWSAPNKDNFLYYHLLFVEQYPALWAAFPLAALIAMVRHRNIGLFCLCLFGAIFVIHSFGGSKQERYLYYGMPFFFAIWGVVLASVATQVRDLARQAMGGVFEAEKLRGLRAPVALACFVTAVVFFLGSNPAYKTTFDLLRSWPRIHSQPSAAWAQARDRLEPYLEDGAVLLTTNDIHAIFYFGDYDFQVSRLAVTETATKQEFGIDPRTGRPAISTPESLRLILACYPSGLFVGNEFQWRHTRSGISPETAEVLEAETRPISLPEQWEMRVFAWERPEAPRPSECATLPGPSRGT